MTERCPKCAAPRGPQATECPACGVIYARFRAAGATRDASTGEAPAAPPALEHAAAAQPGPAPARVHVPEREVEELLVLLARFLESGMTVRAALFTDPWPLPAEAIARLRAGHDAGEPLSALLLAMGLIDQPSAALLGAGERVGAMPATLQQLAARFAERRADRQRLRGLLVRPAITLLAAVVILPVPVLFAAGPAAYARQVVPPLLGFAAAAAAWLWLWPLVPASSPVRRALLRVALAVPGLRAPLWHRAWASFAEVLGASLGAGLPARESLELAARATPAPAFQDAASELVARLDRGDTLLAAASAAPLPAAFLAQLSSAEVSGTLDRNLAGLAAFHRDAERRTAAVVLGVGSGVVAALVMLYAAASIVQGFAGAMGDRASLLDSIGK